MNNLKIMKATKEKKLGTNELQLVFKDADSGRTYPVIIDEKSSTDKYNQASNAVNILVHAQRIGDEVLYNEAFELLLSLAFPAKFVAETISGSKVLSNDLVLDNGELRFRDEVLDSVVVKYIMSLLDSDFTPKDEKTWSGLINFLDNLYLNVSEYVRKQLFGWMIYQIEHGESFAITEDGCFVGYRGTAGTIDAPTSVHTGVAYVDGIKHTGSIPNPIGSTISMPRGSVELNPNVACAPGLHVGSFDYADNWSRGVVLTVKVNPRDVISVPVDSQSQKIRVSEFKVLSAITTQVQNLFLDEEYEEEHEENYFEDDTLKVDEPEVSVTKTPVNQLVDLRTKIHNNDNLLVKYTRNSGLEVTIDCIVAEVESDRIVVKLRDGSYRTILRHKIIEISREVRRDPTEEEIVEYTGKVGDHAIVKYIDNGREQIIIGLVIGSSPTSLQIINSRNKEIVIVPKDKIFIILQIHYEKC